MIFVAFLRTIAAVNRMSRHERRRVRAGCPPARRGEIYCRCDGCVRDRHLVGWEELRPIGAQADYRERADYRPSPMASEP